MCYSHLANWQKIITYSAIQSCIIFKMFVAVNNRVVHHKSIDESTKQTPNPRLLSQWQLAVVVVAVALVDSLTKMMLILTSCGIYHKYMHHRSPNY